MKIEGRDIVLKSLVGSHNYNLANKDSDRDYKVFVIPTFEDLYASKQFSKQIITPEEDNSIHDIRKLTELLFKSNVSFLEVLASNEIIIPSGDNEINEIVSLKKEIFKMNLPHLFDACKGMYFNKMKLLNKGTDGTQNLVDEFGYDCKQALHAYRSLKVIVDFEATDFEDFDSSIRYEGEDLTFMMELRHGVYSQEVFENFVSHYYENTFLKLAERYHERAVNLGLKEELENIVMRLIKRKLLTDVTNNDILGILSKEE